MEVLLVRQEWDSCFKTDLNAIKYFISSLAAGLGGLEKARVFSLEHKIICLQIHFFFLFLCQSVQEKETFFLALWCLQDSSTAQR